MTATARPRAATTSSPSARYRVALVHSFYSAQRPSGENTAVLDQAAALRAAGHEVTVVAAHTDALETERGYALRAALRVATGVGRSPLGELRRLAPDVVHVHNLFPNFGTTWLHRWPGPLVATLHNYRPACAAGTLFRNGTVCTACPDGHRWAGLRHGCYRGTRTASLPLAVAGRRGAPAHPLLRRADRLVMLSERSRAVYLRLGLPADKLALVPNFVDAPRSDVSPDRSEAPPEASPRWLFVGRLSEEKGILPLLRNWPEGEALDVVGSGPLEAACRAVAPRSAALLGSLPRERLLAILPRYTGLVFPSVWYEGAPMVCQEALAAGVPVLALAGSAAADCVRRDGTGAVYHRAEELPQALSAARIGFPALRDHCRRVHAQQYTARSWRAAMTAVYAEAVQGAGALPRTRRRGLAEETAFPAGDPSVEDERCSRWRSSPDG